MKKYTKHYIKYKFEDSPYVYDGGEIESRDSSYVIKKYGVDEVSTKISMGGRPESFSLIAFGFHDINYIEDDDILYHSNKTNSSWVYFGQRLEFDEYNEKEQTIIGNLKDASAFCLIGGFLYPLGSNDITYDEFIEEYYQNLENLNLKILR